MADGDEASCHERDLRNCARGYPRDIGQFRPTNSSEDVALEVVRTLDGAHDVHTVPALRRLLDHPTPDVVADAVQALRALGETVDKPVAKAPARFRVLVNSEPLPAGSKIDWSVKGKDGSVSSIQAVGAEG